MAPATRTRSKKAAAPKPNILTGQALVQGVKEFCGLKANDYFVKNRMDEQKKLLSLTVETEGYEDDKGNLVYEFEKPFEVQHWDSKAKEVVTKICRALVRQRRVSQGLDEAAAEKILRKKGLWDECTTTVTVIEPDAITKAMYQGKLTEAEVDKMFSTTVTWAFIPKVD